MKQLQNNFTTPEQSKRLLELGVPADSADCYLFKFRCKDVYTQWHINLFENKETYSWKMNILSGSQYEYLPCWSVGRLIEIGMICDTTEYESALGRALAVDCYDIIPGFNLIDWCVNEIIGRTENGNMDFSKLEE